MSLGIVRGLKVGVITTVPAGSSFCGWLVARLITRVVGGGTVVMRVVVCPLLGRVFCGDVWKIPLEN